MKKANKVEKTNKQLTRESFDDDGVDDVDVFRLLDAACFAHGLIPRIERVHGGRDLQVSKTKGKRGKKQEKTPKKRNLLCLRRVSRSKSGLMTVVINPALFNKL